MDFDIIYKIVLLLAGLGLVMYGIKVMNSGMLNLLGHKFQGMLAKNSKNSLKSVLLGAGTTTVLQSSAITNVMATGFLNVEIIGLKQAMAISLGTSIGGAVAMFLLMFQSISILKLFTIFVVIGAFMFVLCKKQKTKNISLFIVGLGLLCLGITIMSESVQGLMTFVDMTEFFKAISNPLLMIVLGAILCIFTQSAYPVVAILIPLVDGGLLSFEMACYAILGLNFGAGFAVSLLVAALESNRNGKRLLMFNIFAKLFACVLIALLMLIPNWISFLHVNVCGSQSSISLVLFNLFNNLVPLVLLPFLPQFVKLFKKMFKKRKQKNTQYASFDISENDASNFAVVIEKTRKNYARIFQLNNDFTKESFDVLFGKLDQKKIQSSPKLIERASKLSSNSAIRFCGACDEKNGEILKIFVDMFAHQKEILKSNIAICELSKDFNQNKQKILPKQLKFLQTLSKDILDMQQIVLNVCGEKDNTQRRNDLEVIFKMHDQNEQNMTKAKKGCLLKSQSVSRDNTLFFAIVCELDKIENEICDSAIKISLLED